MLFLTLDYALELNQHLVENDGVPFVAVHNAIHQRIDGRLPGTVCDDAAIIRQLHASQQVDEPPCRVILVVEEFTVLQGNFDQRDGETLHASFHARRHLRIVEYGVQEIRNYLHGVTFSVRDSQARRSPRCHEPLFESQRTLVVYCRELRRPLQDG